MKVAIRDLKNRLSAYLRLVKAGQTVVVSDRGQPIAELSPIGRRRQTSRDRLQRLIESGEVVPGKGRGLAPFDPISVSGRPVSKTLLDDRD